MIKLLGKLPQNPIIALSGGVDSMAVADFVSRSRNIEAAFFHHGTDTSDNALEFLSEYCRLRQWILHVGHITKDKPSDLSPEEHWRNERYAWLDSLDRITLTGHNLDDCVETYIWSSMHGTAKLIPYKRNNIIRPFLTTKKEDLVAWAYQNSVAWIEDDTNADTKYMRNYIRHEIVPRALVVNPGLYKVVSKKINSRVEYN